MKSRILLITGCMLLLVAAVSLVRAEEAKTEPAKDAAKEAAKDGKKDEGTS